MRKILLPLLALAVLMPIAGYAIDEYDHKTVIKQEIENAKQEYGEQLRETKDPEAQKEIEQKIENVDAFKQVIDLDDAMQQAMEDGDKELLEQLLEQQRQLHDDIIKRAGDRVHIENVTDPDLSGQSSWLPKAYATLNDFEFAADYESCRGWDYDFETGGFIDTANHEVDLS